MPRRLLLLAALLAAPIAARAQAPDARGEAVLDRPEYRGTTASAPIPAELHTRNEGGSDGQGLCVIASILTNGRYQRVPGLEGGKDSQLWREAKARPGGYHPQKLEALVDRVHPDEKWASYYGPDAAVLDRLSRQGYPIGATMNTGANYGYRRIAHMVSLLHYRSGGLACVADNNFPGKYSWMPAAEFDRRWVDHGAGWAWIWTRMPAAIAAAPGPFILLLLAAAAAVIAGRKAREGATDDDAEREREPEPESGLHGSLA